MTTKNPLGEFLRSHRLRLDPARVGLRPARTRRTPGLRREEVAERAGISAEWYVKLEQGRAASPSDATLAALGDALLLDPLERAHMRGLAAAGALPAHALETVPDMLRAMIGQYPQPAYVTGERWDILVYNRAAGEVLGFDALSAQDRNILVYMAGAGARSLFGPGWAPQMRRIVALFRTTYDRRAGDPAFDALVARMQRDCPEFGAWWDDHRIALPASGTKTLHQAQDGPLRYDVASFQMTDQPALRLALYTPRVQ